MAIEVKHGGDPSAQIYGRFGGAEGQAWRKALENYLRGSERRELQRRDQIFRDYQMAETQGFRRFMGDQEHAQQMERLRMTEGIRGRDRDRYYRDRRGLIDYRLTAEQRADEGKLRQAMYLIENDETLSPEDKQEARRRIAYRMAGIEPLPTRRDPQTDIDDMIQYHEGLGGYVHIDPSGKIKELTGTGLSAKDAWTMAINATEVDGVPNIEAARKMVEKMMAGQGQVGIDQQGELPGGEGGAPALAAPSTDYDKQAQEIRATLDEIEGQIPAEMEAERRVYGNVVKRVAPDEVKNIPTAEAQIETYRARLEDHRKKKPPKPAPGENIGGLGYNPRSHPYSKWEAEEKELIDAIKEYEQRLAELRKKRDLLTVHSDVLETRRNATLLGVGS